MTTKLKNLNTKKVKIIGNIGFPDLASMEFVGDVLYGVTGNFFDLVGLKQKLSPNKP